jgi:hypothetical protein
VLIAGTLTVLNEGGQMNGFALTAVKYKKLVVYMILCLTLDDCLTEIGFRIMSVMK